VGVALVHRKAVAPSINEISSHLPDSQYRACPLLAGFGLLRGDLPKLPKLDALITCAADNYIALRANSRVKHARIVCITDLPDFIERGVRVYHDRIVREPVRGEEFLCKRGEPDRGHLRGGGERVESCARVRVPEMHGGIAGPPAGGEKGRLPRAPSESLLDARRRMYVSGVHLGMRKGRRLDLL